MEILLVILLAAVFIGPSAYRLYEQYKGPQRGAAGQPPKEGPSYSRRMLRMLIPVLILAVFLALLTLGLYLLANRQAPAI